MTENVHRTLEPFNGLRKGLCILSGDRSRCDGEMDESYSEFLRHLGKVGRRWLPLRLVIRPVIHNAAYSLFGQEIQIRCEQLSGDEDLRRDLEHSNL